MSGLTFGAPLVLASLLLLPAIYWLLRVTPPPARRVMFPPLRLLFGLSSPQETPARTPFWLLVLRMLAGTLVILALAEPTIGSPPTRPGSGPLVLFVDNGWPAAHNWQSHMAALSDAIAEAVHHDRPVVLLPTATASPPSATLLDAGKAERTLNDLVPQPWLPDRPRALAALAKLRLAVPPQILWLSDGLDYGDAKTVAASLAKTGNLTILADPTGNGPRAVQPARNDANGFRVSVIRAGNGAAPTGTVDALGAQGEELASAPFRFVPGATETHVLIPLPLEVRNETARIAIADEESAGAVTLLDSGSKRRAVEVVAASNAQGEQPLLSDTFYLERALAPYADVQSGTVSDAMARNVSVVVLADIGNVSGADHDTLARFVADGGVLVRFAGGRMARNVDDLVPVKLRVGARYLGGALTWSAAQHLAPFPDASPFRGLDIPPDVTVSSQVLAEPSVELGERTWARLTDGTPLVTGAPRGKGWIVLFHVTASPAWSTLPISGLYVEMLRRTLDLAGGARPSDMATGTGSMLPPVATLDGFGRLRKPPPEALPVPARNLERLDASPQHPPGLYGTEGAETALNAVGASTVLLPFSGLAATAYTGTKALPLEGPFLAIAIAILLCDALISLWLRGYVGMPRMLLARGSAIVLAFALLPVHHGRAAPSFDEEAALDTRLAYVITGLPDVDAMSQAGLHGLGMALAARTSYEPKEPLGVHLETDDLSFFPLLYWPMDPREQPLSPQALSKVADYMRNGGTILFDTRDLTLGAVRGADSPGEQTLRRLTARLDLPPLEPIPADHVLTKSFYLLEDFPGRWDGGKVWVEALPPADPDRAPVAARGGDGVSPVIIGGNDWAAAWAVDAQGRPLADVTPGGDEQREMAIRFGINVVMYALTGNYKTDQVHAPAILERLGH